MWDQVLIHEIETQSVIAKLQLHDDFDSSVLKINDDFYKRLKELDCDDLFVDIDAINDFITSANEQHVNALNGIKIAYPKKPSLELIISDDEMRADIKLTGGYRIKTTSPQEILNLLVTEHIVRGIDKSALRKLLKVSASLDGGDVFLICVANGLQATQPKETQFIPLVKDIYKRELTPVNETRTNEKVDLRDLGETISVCVDQPVMKKIPAVQGENGYTVLGNVLLPKVISDHELVASKGTYIDPQNPNQLLASESGTPIIKSKSVEVLNALCLSSVSVKTGHVNFDGDVIISGNIESSMQVKASGNITVGGFIESAFVSAKGDINVKKGIIGHTVSDAEVYTCRVEALGNIVANYAQYSQLRSKNNISLYVHSLNNKIICGGDLCVLNKSHTNGTLSGGIAEVAGKVECFNLGVEGDSATKVSAFTRFAHLKKNLLALKEQYLQAQEETMAVVRQEMALKRKPKAKRTQLEVDTILEKKSKNNKQIEVVRAKIDVMEGKIDQGLRRNFIEAKDKVFTRVTVQFNNEQIITKRVHGSCVFYYNQFEIKHSAKMLTEDMDLV